jgi:hypothetical protein
MPIPALTIPSLDGDCTSFLRKKLRKGGETGKVDGTERFAVEAETTKSVFCAPLWQECPQKIKIGGYIWLYLVIFTAIWLSSRLNLARVFGLGTCCAFLVFFFETVNAKSQSRQGATRL